MFNVRITIKAMEEVLLCRDGLLQPKFHDAGAVILKPQWAAESPGRLVKHSPLASPPESVIRQIQVGLRTCISSKLRGHAAAAGPTPHLGDPACRKSKNVSTCGGACKLAPGLLGSSRGEEGGVRTIWKSPRRFKFESLISRL